MTTQEQIDSFHQFASAQIAGDGSDKTIDELYDQWRYENLPPEQAAENIAAVQAAIDDMRGGDAGRDAGEIEREMRAALNLPVGE